MTPSRWELQVPAVTETGVVSEYAMICHPCCSAWAPLGFHVSLENLLFFSPWLSLL